jgi:hypothetical protein
MFQAILYILYRYDQNNDQNVSQIRRFKVGGRGIAITPRITMRVGGVKKGLDVDLQVPTKFIKL